MFKVQVPAKTSSGWRSLPDTAFPTVEKAEAYGKKYHTGKHGESRYRVIDARIADANTRSDIIVEGMTPIWNNWLAEDMAARDDLA